MNKKSVLLGMALVSVFIFGIILESKAAPKEQSGKATQKSKAPPSSRWDTVLRTARGEGSLIVYTSANPVTKQAISKVMKEEYGITVDFIVGRGQEFAPRISKENQAGLYLGDLMLTGASTVKLDPFFQAAGTLANLDSALILPDVTDPTHWRGKQLPFVDKEHLIVSLVSRTSSYVAVNTDSVKPKDIQSFRDLINPKWKGKIVMDDPTAPSGAATNWSQLMLALFGIEKGKEYLQQIAKQDIVFIVDKRLQLEWLARNKYPISVGAEAQTYSEFKASGAHIDYLKLSEGSGVTSGAGCLAMLKRAAHPNASLVLINWLLTKEGQTIFQKAFGAPSGRLDVDMTGIEPCFIPQEGEILISDTSDEWYNSKAARSELVKQIFKPLTK